MTPRTRTVPPMLMAALILAAAAAFRPAAAQASRETVAIIGTGNVGSTLGKIWARAGHTIIYGSRTPNDERVRALVAETGNGASATTQQDAVARSQLVLLAVPGNLVEEVVAGLGDLTGKLIIDPTNTAGVRNGYIIAPDDPRVSIAERVQRLAPGATVVKAFNTMNVAVMENPSIAGGPVTVPLSGSDAGAKRRIARLVEDVGLEPLDVGPLASAGYLEEMLRLYIGFRMLNPGQQFEYHLRLRPD